MDESQASRETRKRKHEKEDKVVEEDKVHDMNKFSNDGSFLELFKAKMQSQTDKSKVTKVDEPCSNNSEQQTIKLIQTGVGRPKALQKSLELRAKRKRHREQLEGQKKREEMEQTEEGKTWKKYLAEMKAYEERLCIDKDNTARPLVK